MGDSLVGLALAELVGLVALLTVAGRWVCAEMHELQPRRKRRRAAGRKR